jgi:hypothetical protein
MQDKNIPCLICDKEIIPLAINKEDDIISQLSWQNGDVNIFPCGFGSKFDKTNFIIAICDECIEKKLLENKISILNINE